MAGTLFGLPLSQPVDLNGKPQVGCRLYITAAGSFTTPAVAYKDFGLTAGQEHPYPIPSDAWGRIPIFWLADGSYAFRLIDQNGLVLSSSLNVQALGPSSGSGGGGSPVDPDALFKTGFVMWCDISGTQSGFVRDNGRTIGSPTSGATERANSDTAALYDFLWQRFDNTICPVTGGRGVSSTADFAANKAIGLPDKRGRGPMGLDDMGNAAASRFPSQVPFTYGDAITPGALGGQNVGSLAQAELPAVSPTFSGTTETYPIFDLGTGGFLINSGFGGSSGLSGALGVIGSPRVTITPKGTISALGSGTAMNKTALFVLGTFYRRL